MNLHYNVPITFGPNGKARDLNATGMDFTDAGDQSWTSAPVAELDILLPPARQDVAVQLAATPFLIPGVLAAQPVFIYLGGLFIGYWVLKSFEVRTFPINRNILSGRPNRLSLVMPNATSPSVSAVSEDIRELGIYLESIVFNT
jgi:hypothetical protein